VNFFFDPKKCDSPNMPFLDKLSKRPTIKFMKRFNLILIFMWGYPWWGPWGRPYWW
jgi:hypothetical protein